jgi:hypothetical protein
MSDAAEVQTTERKKPGRKPRERSAAGLSIEESQRAGLSMNENDSRDPNSQLRNERVRIPMGAGQDQWLRGYVLDTENFHYHLFHESQTRGGRVAEADGAFYEHCQINGENIKRPSGSGFDYLMRLPIKYYQQDMQRDRDRRNLLEKNHTKLSGDDKLQEYGVDKHGRPVFDEARPSRQSTTQSRNPYAD